MAPYIMVQVIMRVPLMTFQNFGNNYGSFKNRGAKMDPEIGGLFFQGHAPKVERALCSPLSGAGPAAHPHAAFAAGRP